uniref:Protein FAR1-RELATED SEQUENCE n=2 Tax=Cucumis melo TaxID=3656 RepID=A0A9I9EE43_CUCME
MRLMELEKGVQPGYLPFTEKDVRNLLQSFRKLDHEEESFDLLRMCRNIKEKDPNFKFEYVIDSNNRLENIAWSYASSIQAYETFGDAVVFDTTHRLTAFDMPLGIWVGINNYGMPCFLSCVLLREENLRSITWALKDFPYLDLEEVRSLGLELFCKLLSDGDGQQRRTAGRVRWLDRRRRVESNGMGGEINGQRLVGLRVRQRRRVRLFVAGKLRGRQRGLAHWIGRRLLIPLEATAAAAAVASVLSLLLRSDTILKAINTKSCLCGNPRIGRKTTIVHHVAVVVDFKDQVGEQQTMQQNLQNIGLKIGAPMESHAATILTPFAFSKLQEQLVLAAHYSSFQMDDGFLVRHHTKADGGRKFYWVPREGIISCSCHQFEFSGILCRHAIRVLSTGNCFQIPDSYLPIRWRRISMPSAKLLPSTTNDHVERIQLLQSMVTNLVIESAKSQERLDFANEQVSLLLSRVREHPTSLPGSRDVSTIHGNL